MSLMVVDPYKFTMGEDPFINQIGALLHFDGKNGSKVFLDYIQNRWNVLDAATSISTANGKFNQSMFVNGGSGGISSSSSGTTFQITGDFTSECFFSTSSLSADRTILIHRQVTSNVLFYVYLTPAGALQLSMGGGTGSSATGLVAINTWYHLALCRSGSIVRLFLNGVQVISFSNSTMLNSGVIELYVGNGTLTTGNAWSGYIDEFRFTKAARYTSNFTPPNLPFANPSNIITIFGATGVSYGTSVTSMTTPLTPTEVDTGDYLLAFVMHRSALTPPAGWTFLKSQSNTGTLTQTISVYRRTTPTSADAAISFNWTQASAGRMGVGYMAFRSTTGAIKLLATDSASNANPSSTSHSVTVPVVTATMQGEVIAIAAANEVADASATQPWSPSSGATLQSASVVDNRMAMQTQNRNTGQSTSTPMTFTLASAAVGTFESVSIRMGWT